MFEAVDNVVTDIDVDLGVLLSFELLVNEMSALPLFKCVSILWFEISSNQGVTLENYLQLLQRARPL